MNPGILAKGVAAFVLFSAFAVPAWAEPYIAIREGMKCSQCHANQTGGGKRTPYGAAFGITSLPMVRSAPWEKEGGEKRYEGLRNFLSGQITEYFTFGADVRASNETLLVPAGPSSPRERRNQFSVDEANLYLEFDPLPEQLILYLDTQFAPGNAKAREVFALWKDLPLQGYAKAGRFFPPYGLRLFDDSAFIRRQTGFSFQSSDAGVEVGIEPGPFSMVVALTNGTNSDSDDNADKRVSGVASWSERWGRLGGSAAWNDASTGSRASLGGFLGGTFSRLTVFAEADWIRDELSASPLRHRLALLGEIDVLISQGFNFKTVYEYFDPDLDFSEDQQIRWTFLLESFLIQSLQARLGGRIADAPPQLPAERAEEIFVEIHVFL
ncbi:MAG: hypothetical protein AB1405_06205 [Bdellovibrionota bacterium]